MASPKESTSAPSGEEALLPAPKVITTMIDRAIAAGVSASYALMDSWFTHAPLIQEIVDRGLHVIGMIKNDNKRYLVNGSRLSLKELYLAAPRLGKNSDILRSIRTELAPGIPVLVYSSGIVRRRMNGSRFSQPT